MDLIISSKLTSNQKRSSPKTPTNKPTKCSPSLLLLPLRPLAWPLPYQLLQVSQLTEPFKLAESNIPKLKLGKVFEIAFK